MATLKDIMDARALMEEARTDARKEMAKDLLDRIKYEGSGGDDDYRDLMMLMGELTEIEENG